MAKETKTKMTPKPNQKEKWGGIAITPSPKERIKRVLEGYGLEKWQKEEIKANLYSILKQAQKEILEKALTPKIAYEIYQTHLEGGAVEVEDKLEALKEAIKKEI